MEDKNTTLSVTLLVGLSLIWGTSFILMKRGLVVFSPGEVAALRVTVAGIILLPLAAARLKEIKSGHPSKLFLSGMLGIFIPAFLFTEAQKHMESSLAGVLNSLSPLWTMIVGALFFNVVFKRSSIFGVVMGLVGAVVLMFSQVDGKITGVNWYALLVVGACACYGLNLNFIKFRIPDVRSLTLTSVSVVLIAPLAAIYLFGFTDFLYKMSAADGAWKAFGFIALLAFMSTAIAGFIFNKLVKLTTPLFASTVTYLIPVVSVAWGVFDGEHLFLSHYIGMAAILGGVYLANRKTN